MCNDKQRFFHYSILPPDKMKAMILTKKFVLPPDVIRTMVQEHSISFSPDEMQALGLDLTPTKKSSLFARFLRNKKALLIAGGVVAASAVGAYFFDMYAAKTEAPRPSAPPSKTVSVLEIMQNRK